MLCVMGKICCWCLFRRHEIGGFELGDLCSMDSTIHCHHNPISSTRTPSRMTPGLGVKRCSRVRQFPFGTKIKVKTTLYTTQCLQVPVRVQNTSVTLWSFTSPPARGSCKPLNTRK